MGEHDRVVAVRTPGSVPEGVLGGRLGESEVGKTVDRAFTGSQVSSVTELCRGQGRAGGGRAGVRGGRRALATVLGGVT